MDQILGDSDDRFRAGLQVNRQVLRGPSRRQSQRKQFVDRATGAHINTAEAFTGQVERAMVGVYHILFPEHLQRYLDNWRWSRRELAGEIRGPNSSRKHRIWKPVRVVAHMVELLRNARPAARFAGHQTSVSGGLNRRPDGLCLVDRWDFFGAILLRCG